MIKGIADQANGRKLVILGISEANVQRLKRDEPILVKGSEIGVGVDVMIYYGATDAELVRQIASEVDKDTKLHRSKEPEHGKPT